jgi:hypothetical protein
MEKEVRLVINYKGFQFGYEKKVRKPGKSTPTEKISDDSAGGPIKRIDYYA